MRAAVHTSIAISLAVLLWEIIAQLAAGSFTIAGPSAIAQNLVQNSGLYLRATGATITAAVAGFAIGNLVAIGLAVLVLLIPRCERVTTMLALLFFCLPLVATGPILRVLFGPGLGPQITLAALAVYYTTYLVMLIGLRAIPQSWSDLNASYGRGRWSELIHIRIRAAIPYLTAGLQIAAPVAFLGTMIGEFTGAERGLGVLTLQAMRGLDVTGTWTVAALATGISTFFYAAFGWLGRWMSPHRPVLLLSAALPAKQASWRMRLATALGIGTLCLALWYGLMELYELNRFFAKRPDDIWRFLITSPQASAARGEVFGALGQTLSLTLPGYFAGLVLGAGMACLATLMPVLARGVIPVAIALRSVPIITTAPLLVLALGRGATGTITIVAVMIFFPTLVACLEGMRQVPGQVLDLFDSYRAGRIKRLIWAQIPSMLPALFASARMAVPAALLAATTTEWLATGKGIGNLMALTATTSNYNMLWSATLVLALVAVAFYLLIEALERRVLSIYASEQVAR